MSTGQKLRIHDMSEVSFSTTEFDSWLGKTFSSCIFRGEFKGVPCAVKRYHAATGSIDDRGFVREVQSLSELAHENIIQILGYFAPRPNALNQNYVLVMELAQLDLSKIIYPSVSLLEFYTLF